MGRILGIDYGQKRTGIAVTDPLKIIASPLTTVDTKDLSEFLKSYIAQENVEEIVVGWPLDLDNKATDSTEMVRRFIQKLKQDIPDVVVKQWDERFTSRLAKKAILEGGIKKQGRRDKKLVDKVSASLILQSYLGI